MNLFQKEASRILELPDGLSDYDSMVLILYMVQCEKSIISDSDVSLPTYCCYTSSQASDDRSSLSMTSMKHGHQQ